MHRQALMIAGVLAAASTGTAHAQTRGTPNADTPRILIGTFRSADRQLGAQSADAVRNRVSSEFLARDLWAIQKNDINATLEGSGYRPDSALSPNDMKELAKYVRADEILDGFVTRTPTGVRIDARLLLSRDVALAEPLPTAEAAKPADAAKAVVKSLEAARKQLADNRKCENHLRASEFDKAIAAANAGIAKYPEAVLSRLCLVSAYQLMKAPSDSILRVTDEIIKRDPKSRIALGLRYEAYKNANNQEKALETLVGMLEADPTNQQLQTGVVEELARSGQANRAVPIVNKLVEENVGDVSLLRLKWAVLRRAEDWKNAVAAGEEMVKIDTALADTTYFLNQIAALTADSQPQRAAEMAARGAQRFPQNVGLLVAQAAALRSAGQMEAAAAAAQRAIAVDPQSRDAHILIIRSYAEANQLEQAMMAIQRANAAGVDKAVLAQFALNQGNALYRQAEAIKSEEPAQQREKAALYTRAITVLNTAESIAPQPAAKFLIGASNLNLAVAALQEGQKNRNCASLARADEYFTQAQINTAQGGSFNPEAAKQVLGAVQQYSPYVPQLRKSFNCR